MSRPRPARSSSAISSRAEARATAAGLDSGSSAWMVPKGKGVFGSVASLLRRLGSLNDSPHQLQAGFHWNLLAAFSKLLQLLPHR
jgi:hypothetical protein